MTETRFDSPQAAESAFYEAFQRADLDAMRAVWADDDDIVCVHPMGPRLQGRDAVMQSWRDILGSGAALRFHVNHSHFIADAGLSVHSVHENISQGTAVRGLVIATNVYRKTADGWRMVLHHGSPGNVELVPGERPDVMH